jgi:methylmalonyl-CoA mutase C-terminal domain/subunit
MTTPSTERRPRPVGHHTRVVIAKVGLDGHDRGAKVVARVLRDAGYEVIYTGLRQTPETVVSAAVAEDAAVLGVSMLSGAHLALARRILELLRAEGADIPVVFGGIIPEQDITTLKKHGVAAVFTPGARMEDLVAAFDEISGVTDPG